MSEENVDVVKRFEQLMVPALDESDAHASEQRLEEIKAILDPDVVFYASPAIPHGGTYRGYDAFFKMGEQFRNLWDISAGVEIRYIDGGGDIVITLAKWTGISKLTGKSVPVDMVEVLTIKDGRIKELRAYYEDTVILSEAADGAKGPYNPGLG
jgi:ketosteroid isomerase-like protein